MTTSNSSTSGCPTASFGEETEPTDSGHQIYLYLLLWALRDEVYVTTICLATTDNTGEKKKKRDNL